MKIMENDREKRERDLIILSGSEMEEWRVHIDIDGHKKLQLCRRGWEREENISSNFLMSTGFLIF